MAAIKYTAQRGLSLLGDEKGVWMASTTAETLVGSELVTNGDFAADTDWTKGTGWTIASGVATKTSGTGASLVQPSILGTIGDVVIITYTVLNYVAGNITMWAGSPGGAGTARSANGTYTETLTVSGNSTLYIAADASFDGDIDNVSIRLAVPDLSTGNDGLGVYGSIVKSEVATGAGLMGYSGFSASNYLEQPYNSALDFGTGDFCITGFVVSTTSGSATYMQRTDYGSGYGTVQLVIKQQSANELYVGLPSSSITTPGAINDGKPRIITVLRRSGTVYIFINGVIVGSFSNSDNISNPGAVLVFGVTVWNGSMIQQLTSGSLSLWRAFNYAPTAAQIKARYNDEKHLFKKYSTYTQKGESYSTDIRLQSADNSVRTHKTDNISLDRTQTETIVNGDDNEIDITTGLLHRTDKTYSRISEFSELMYATRASEPFEIDLYGTVASPDEPKTVIRVGDRVQENREGVNWLRAGFKVREQ